MTEEYVVKKYDPYIYIYVKSNYSLLRQQNIQDLFPGEEDLSILEIYSYKDTFIIIIQLAS